MVHASFEKKPQKLRAEGGTPTKAKAEPLTTTRGSRDLAANAGRRPAQEAKSFAPRAAPHESKALTAPLSSLEE